MDDVEWLYRNDLREKKSTAISARHTKGKVIGPKGCKLPMDNLTNKEIKAMNGPVMMYELDKAVHHSVFVTWPTDIQKEYLKRLQDRYNANDEMIGKALSVHLITAGKYRRTLGLATIPRSNKPDISGFEKFLKGKAEEVDEAPKEPVSPSVPSFVVDELSVQVTAKDWESVMQLLKSYDISSGYTVRIEFTKEKEN